MLAPASQVQVEVNDAHVAALEVFLYKTRVSSRVASYHHQSR